jgi:hypothetical protein
MTAPQVLNMFAGFDDYMEEKEPGYKAKRAQERAEREAADAAFAKELIKRYGSKKKALAPTKPERVIMAATAQFERKERKNGYAFTTLDGWSPGELQEAPEHVQAAVAAALPLPASIITAAAENDAWEARNREYEVLLGRIGDWRLPMACCVRQRIVCKLLETGLRAESLQDVLVRQRYYMKREYEMNEIGHAVLADLEHLAAKEASYAR